MPYTADLVAPLWNASGLGLTFPFQVPQDQFTTGIVWNPEQPSSVYGLVRDTATQNAAVVAYDAATMAVTSGGVVQTVAGSGQVTACSLTMAPSGASLYCFGWGGDSSQSTWQNNAGITQIDASTLAVLQQSPAPISAGSGVCSGIWGQQLSLSTGRMSASQTGAYALWTQGHAGTSGASSSGFVPYALWDTSGNAIKFGVLTDVIGASGIYATNYDACSVWDNSDNAWVIMRSSVTANKQYLAKLAPTTSGGVRFSSAQVFTPDSDVSFIGINYNPSTDRIIGWGSRASDERGQTRMFQIETASGTILSEIVTDSFTKPWIAQQGGWVRGDLYGDYDSNFAGPAIISLTSGLKQIYPPALWADATVEANAQGPAMYNSALSGFYGYLYDSGNATETSSALFVGTDQIDSVSYLQTPYDVQDLNARVDWSNERAYVFGYLVTSHIADTLWVCDTTRGNGGALLNTSGVSGMCVISGNDGILPEASCFGTDGFFYGVTGIDSQWDVANFASIKISKFDTSSLQEVAAASLAISGTGLDGIPNATALPFTANGVDFIGVFQSQPDATPQNMLQVFRCSDLAPMAISNEPSTFGSIEGWLVVGEAPTSSTRKLYANYEVSSATHDLVGAWTYDALASSLTFSGVADHVATDFDAGWTGVIALGGFVFDPSDNNVIISAQPTSRNTSTQPDYLAKINTSTGAIIWKIPIGQAAANIDNGKNTAYSTLTSGVFLFPDTTFAYPNPLDGTYYTIDTASGNVTSGLAGGFLQFSWYAGFTYDGNSQRVLCYSNGPNWYGWTVWNGPLSSGPSSITRDFVFNLDVQASGVFGIQRTFPFSLETNELADVYVANASGQIFATTVLGTDVLLVGSYGFPPHNLLASGQTLYSLLPTASGIGTYATRSHTSGFIAGPPISAHACMAMSGVFMAVGGWDAQSSSSGFVDIAAAPTVSGLFAGIAGDYTVGTWSNTATGVWDPNNAVSGVGTPRALAWAPLGDQFLACDPTGGNVYVFDFSTTTTSLLQTLPLANAYDIAVTPNGQHALVCQPGSDALTELSVSGVGWATSGTVSGIASPQSIVAISDLHMAVGCSSGIANVILTSGGTWIVDSVTALPFNPLYLALDSTSGVIAAGTAGGSGYLYAAADQTTFTGDASGLVYSAGRYIVADNTNSLLRIYSLGTSGFAAESAPAAPTGVSMLVIADGTIFAATSGVTWQYGYAAPYAVQRNVTGKVSVYDGSWHTADLPAQQLPMALTFDASGNVLAATLYNSLYTVSMSGVVTASGTVTQFSGQPQGVPLGISSLLIVNGETFATSALNNTLVDLG